MGKKIEQLPAYGSSDSDKKKADIWEVSKNSGTSGSPVYASDGSRKIRQDEMANELDIPCKVTNGTTIALLVNPANWTNNIYTGGTPITGQKTGDWYDDGAISYRFVTGNTVISRIPYANL